MDSEIIDMLFIAIGLLASALVATIVLYIVAVKRQRLLADLCDDAWGVIANAGHPGLGDWEGLNKEWQAAADRWLKRWLESIR